MQMTNSSNDTDDVGDADDVEDVDTEDDLTVDSMQAKKVSFTRPIPFISQSAAFSQAHKQFGHYAHANTMEMQEMQEMDVERKARSDSGLTDTDGLFNDSPPGSFALPCSSVDFPPLMLPPSTTSMDMGYKKRSVDAEDDHLEGMAVEKRGRSIEGGDHLSLLLLTATATRCAH